MLRDSPVVCKRVLDAIDWRVMEYSIEKDPSGKFMHFRTRGDAKVDGLATGFASIFQADSYQPRMPILADHRELKVGRFMAREMRLLVSRQAELRAQISGTRVATLVSSPVIYGMARMWISFSRAGQEFQIFHDEDAARMWLLNES